MIAEPLSSGGANWLPVPDRVSGRHPIEVYTGRLLGIWGGETKRKDGKNAGAKKVSRRGRRADAEISNSWGARRRRGEEYLRKGEVWNSRICSDTEGKNQITKPFDRNTES